MDADHPSEQLAVAVACCRLEAWLARQPPSAVSLEFCDDILYYLNECTLTPNPYSGTKPSERQPTLFTNFL